ncbi:MAG: SprT-like domain-containing protein [Pyrinomonadaceae bacterium]
MINKIVPRKIEIIQSYYEEAFAILGPKRKTPPIEVIFYPYVGINHTIRVRDGQVYVRIGEICRDMPRSCQNALAYILVAKLLRKAVPIEARDLYSDYIKTPQMRERAADSRRENGRKVITTPVGENYDLNRIFADLNRRYFRSRLAKPTLTWSARQTFRILGHHDSTHNTVVVSRSLDARDVPKYIVEYVVFHEMLHIYHPTQHINGRRYNHTPEFRRDEAKFEFFHEAEHWIERNVLKLKRRAKRK